MVLLGRRVRGHGLSDLLSNWSWLMGWDYTHSRSPSRDPFCPAPRIESPTSGSSAQPWTIEIVNVTNCYKHGRYCACALSWNQPKLKPKLSIRGAGQKDCRGLGRKVDHIWTKATAKGAFIYSSPRSSAMVKNGSQYYAFSLLHMFWIHSLSIRSLTVRPCTVFISKCGLFW